ncbi:MAG: hypothetical protein M1820_004965 [Bogoriella megaspora]|nr:MAG: hypothetical protein M1820_004965 [Bogoriella megaspora]
MGKIHIAKFSMPLGFWTFAVMFAALAIAIICVTICTVPIILTKRSYSTAFSTILRTTKNAQLSVDIDPQDADGKDPVPKYIRNAVITFGLHKNSEHYAQIETDAENIRSGSGVVKDIDARIAHAEILSPSIDEHPYNIVCSIETIDERSPESENESQQALTRCVSNDSQSG